MNIPYIDLTEIYRRSIKPNFKKLLNEFDEPDKIVRNTFSTIFEDFCTGFGFGHCLVNIYPKYATMTKE